MCRLGCTWLCGGGVGAGERVARDAPPRAPDLSEDAATEARRGATGRDGAAAAAAEEEADSEAEALAEQPAPQVEPAATAASIADEADMFSKRTAHVCEQRRDAKGGRTNQRMPALATNEE